jgi:putative ABC transport system permease protein
MFIFKRALIYVRRKKSKVLTIGVILLVVSTLALTGLVINSAAKTTFEYARNSLGATVNYTTDLSSVMPTERGIPGQGMGVTIPDDYEVINVDEIEYIKSKSVYIESYTINTSLAASPIDFSYYNPSGETISDSKRVAASINILGSSYDKDDTIFKNDQNELIEGRYFTDEEIDSKAPVIIIESTIASLNELEIGDFVTIEEVIRRMPGEEEATEIEEYTFEIEGIYKTNNPSDVSTTDFKGSFNLTENNMYAPYTTILNYSDNAINSVTFNLNDTDNIDLFIEEVKAMDMNTTYRLISANDAAYNKMVGPIASVAKTSTVLVTVVVISGALIILLLSMLSIKDRKYEIGVLLSLGESRLKIVSQLLFEMIIISTISFTLAVFISGATSQITTNYLLESALIEETTEEPARGFNRFVNLVTTNVEVIDELDVSVKTNDIILMLAIGMLIIVVGNISQSLYVLKANPKEILLER